MLAKGDEVDVEVRLEDQLQINEFGRNNDRISEMKHEVKTMQEELERLDDANTELMMQDGDNVRLMVGDSFLHVSEDFCTDHLEQKQGQEQEKLDALKATLTELMQRQEVLKRGLYSRFGTSINLEE